MAKDDINVKSSGETVDGEKAKKQKAELAAVQKRAEEDKAKAKAKQQEKKDNLAAEQKKIDEHNAEVKKQKAAAEKAAKDSADKKDSLVNNVTAVGGVAAAALASSVKSGKIKLNAKTIIIGLLVVVLLGGALFFLWPKISFALGLSSSNPGSFGDLLPDAVMGYTEIDFNNAILGEARQKQELIVWEQDVKVDTEISNALANIAIFKKTKTIHSLGTGVYTVDMSQITDASITVDNTAMTVTIAVPHTRLQYINKDLDATTFEDTQHALLGFGDIKLTQEQQLLVEQSIEEAMRTELVATDRYADADKAALLKVYDTYQPVVSKLSDEYTLEIVFDESTANADVSKGASSSAAA